MKGLLRPVTEEEIQIFDRDLQHHPKNQQKQSNQKHIVLALVLVLCLQLVLILLVKLG